MNCSKRKSIIYLIAQANEAKAAGKAQLYKDTMDEIEKFTNGQFSGKEGTSKVMIPGKKKNGMR